MTDNVNHPRHYNTGTLEVIDVIEDWKLDFHLGNAVKYIARSQHKGRPVEDLQKALWYIQRRIDRLKVDVLESTIPKPAHWPTPTQEVAR